METPPVISARQDCDPIGAPPRSGLSPYAVVRVLLGLVLLAAAGLKLHELLTRPLAGEGLFGARWFRAVQVEAELLLGLWLLSGLAARAAWGAALAAFATFGAVAAYQAFTGASSCGCFGAVRVDPMWTFALDAAAVAALVLWRPSDRQDRAARPSRRRLIAFAVAAFALGTAAAAAVVLHRPATLSAEGEVADEGSFVGDTDLVLLEPSKWAGRRFPLLQHIDVGPQLASGRWTVVLYHPNCAKCRKSVPQYEQAARERAHDPAAPRVALIEMPPYAAKAEWRAAAGGPAVVGKLDESKEWVATTPVEIQLADGVVQTTQSDGSGM